MTVSLYNRGSALIRQALSTNCAANSGTTKWVASRQASHAPLFFGKPSGFLLNTSPNTMQRGAKYLSNVPNYEEKYREKLLKRAREKGVDTIDELKQKIKEQEHRVDAAATVQSKNKETPHTPTSRPKPSKPVSSNAQRVLDRSSTASANNLPPTVKALDQIVRLDKLHGKSAAEIGEIWTTFHATKDCISAAIPAHTYRQLLAVARKNPLFILPLPRDQGIEFFFLQFNYHQVYFTSLLEYKTNTVNARPYLTLTHYTDLIDSNDLVLMRGELDGEKSKLLDVQNAQYLALQLQQFYVTGGPEKRALLEKFNQAPEKFDYNELVQVAQKL
ncbi:hypothetical protein IW140_005140 [Coemansia sp. RSA 1813]|nr:hypothetical protein EV178_005118 [Coemansia sp. RSA 1646]KAJ1766813.1 hypothetical protein LPJ74_005692 [Coemansia sp. RSA 1843]KAJ2088020.1 hypothetical protein IW138_004528 [Coemansia sp. RSA 986]KAJ2211961.1 hypothetical protein EV179_005068 [Coemansia sp. RSA 487]KAJ2565858.1 hypothetical protein IW140_005140 [Coemansia sp. RSA 1813]